MGQGRRLLCRVGYVGHDDRMRRRKALRTGQTNVACRSGDDGDGTLFGHVGLLVWAWVSLEYFWRSRKGRIFSLQKRLQKGDGKEIRFIDSHYKDLFHIPDGSCVQIHYPDEMVVKPCTFIDEYHTQIGYNVFHICQFAEIMERNGASYMPEPEIMGDEAAWKVGKDRILAVQTCEDGYDYTLLDENYNEIDGGQVDNPELSMLEVRRDILESFGLERRELRAMFYEDVMEQAFEVGRQAVVVNDPIAELAFKLDRFAENFDPYEYMDQVDDVQAHIQEIKADLAAGNTAPYREFLNTAIEEAREETAVEVAKVLKSQLDKLDSPKRESVMEKLAQAAEKAAPASPSPKRKEPER